MRSRQLQSTANHAPSDAKAAKADRQFASTDATPDAVAVGAVPNAAQWTEATPDAVVPDAAVSDPVAVATAPASAAAAATQAAVAAANRAAAAAADVTAAAPAT